MTLPNTHSFPSMRLTHTINLALLLLLWLVSLWAYPRLPEQIPVHFGAAGTPDRWASTSALAWFGLPLAAALLTALTYLFARLLPSRPTWVNVPQKERYRTLPDHRKRSVIAQVLRLLWGTNALVLAVLCAIQLASYRAAHGHSTQGLIVGVLLLTVLSTPVILAVWLPPIQRELDRQLRADEAERLAGDDRVARGRDGAP